MIQMNLLSLNNSQIFHIASIFFNWKHICTTDHSEIVYHNGHPVLYIKRNEKAIILRNYKEEKLMLFHENRIIIYCERQTSSDWKELFRYLKQEGFEI